MSLLSKTMNRISEIQKLNEEIRQIQRTILKGGLIPEERDRLWAKMRELKAKREEIAK